MQYKAKKITRPKVVPQGPTAHKIITLKDNKEQTRMKTETQEPTSIQEVVPQAPILQLDTTKIEEHPEATIIKDNTTMLKGLATSMIVTTSKLKVPQSLEASIKRYTTWFLNEIP